MGWFTRRKIKQFIKNPDSLMVVNPKFCDHNFVNGICLNCKIKKVAWKKENSYNV